MPPGATRRSGHGTACTEGRCRRDRLHCATPALPRCRSFRESVGLRPADSSAADRGADFAEPMSGVQGSGNATARWALRDLPQLRHARERRPISRVDDELVSCVREAIVPAAHGALDGHCGRADILESDGEAACRGPCRQSATVRCTDRRSSDSFRSSSWVRLLARALVFAIPRLGRKDPFDHDRSGGQAQPRQDSFRPVRRDQPADRRRHPQAEAIEALEDPGARHRVSRARDDSPRAVLRVQEVRDAPTASTPRTRRAAFIETVRGSEPAAERPARVHVTRPPSGCRRSACWACSCSRS